MFHNFPLQNPVLKLQSKIHLTKEISGFFDPQRKPQRCPKTLLKVLWWCCNNFRMENYGLSQQYPKRGDELFSFLAST